MFTTRQLRIIAYLISSNGWIKGGVLANEIGISNRTLQMDIKQINHDVPLNVAIISNNRLGYRLEDTNHFFYSALQKVEQHDIESDEFFTHPTQILILMLFEKDFIKIQEIAERLYLSKSTVNSNLGLIKRIVNRTFHSQFLMSSSKGIKIEAPENLKRIMIMKAMEKDYDALMFSNITKFKDIYHYQSVLEHILPNVFIKHNLIITGEALHNFTRYLSICIVRSTLGMMDEEIFVNEHELLGITQVIVDIVQRDIAYTFTKTEVIQINNRILEINLLEVPVEKNQFGLKVIQQFQEEIYAQTNFWLTFSYEIKRMFAEHIERMKSRTKSGRNNRGYNTNELFRQYPLEIHLLKTCLSPVLNLEISKGELGYLVYYLAAAIASATQKYALLFVSDESTGSILYIKEELLHKLQDKIKTVTCIPTYMFLEHEEEYLQSHHFFMTTDQRLTLKYNSFVLVNKTIVPHQFEGVLQNVRDMITQTQREEIADMKKILQEDIVLDEKVEFKDLLQIVTLRIKDANISLESIGNSMLCIISHSSHPSFLQRVYLKHPMNYKRKPITKLLIANYGKEGNILCCFSYIQQVIEKM